MMHVRSTEVSAMHKSVGMLEKVSAQQLDALPSPRIMNTHLQTEALPKVQV